jgi:hypothetical protein
VSRERHCCRPISFSPTGSWRIRFVSAGRTTPNEQFSGSRGISHSADTSILFPLTMISALVLFASVDEEGPDSSRFDNGSLKGIAETGSGQLIQTMLLGNSPLLLRHARCVLPLRLVTSVVMLYKYMSTGRHPKQNGTGT